MSTSDHDPIYRDDHLIAVNKPPGLLMHATALARRGEPTLVDQLRAALDREVWPVHRLDRATSGLLVLALSRDAASRLGQAFQSHAVDKRYLAVVRGWPDDAGVIDHPVKDRDEPQRPARDGLTHYRTLARSELAVGIEKYPTSRFALVELQPRTGRRHQLRRHLKHINHPLIGDTTFGRGPYNRYFRDQVGVGRLLLHAWRLTFPHPASGEGLTLTAAPDPAFLAALAGAGLSESECGRRQEVPFRTSTS